MTSGEKTSQRWCGALWLFQLEENDIWRKDKSEVKGIFRREAPKLTAPCFGGVTATIRVIFGLEILPEVDNNILFMDRGPICIQRLPHDCCRIKKHALLSG
ncbi:hypothetical protein TIFTF001_029240 [Ficus carica]|uniref:Uncharacterized protein n=1 Tax=Ficus carica TaxID=3494 RepID=A0AA88DS11_FICCA|nr:hypothetical protein TIFTF001_029240 [Ficus carica]